MLVDSQLTKGQDLISTVPAIEVACSNVVLSGHARMTVDSRTTGKTHQRRARRRLQPAQRTAVFSWVERRMRPLRPPANRHAIPGLVGGARARPGPASGPVYERSPAVCMTSRRLLHELSTAEPRGIETRGRPADGAVPDRAPADERPPSVLRRITSFTPGFA